MNLSGNNSSIHLLGVEDGSFRANDRSKPQYTLLCGVEMCSNRIESVMLTKVEVDGFDTTEELLRMIAGVKVDAIILGGITFAGFNVIDPSVIYEETGIPIIVYSGEKPNNENILRALTKHFPDWERRWKIIENLGKIYSIKPHEEEPEIFYEVVGATAEWAEGVLRKAAVISRIPEPVRVAGLIAKGLSRAS